MSSTKVNIRKTFLIIYFSGLLSVLPVLISLPADFFDKGPVVCLSVLLFDHTCPGCGITRAIQHLIHLQFKTAWDFNHLVVLVAPALLYGLVDEVIRTRKRLSV